MHYYYVCPTCHNLSKKEIKLRICSFCGEKAELVISDAGKKVFEENDGKAFEGAQEVSYDIALKRAKLLGKKKPFFIDPDPNIIIYDTIFGGSAAYIMYKGAEMFFTAKYVADRLSSLPFLFVGGVWLSMIVGFNIVWVKMKDKNK